GDRERLADELLDHSVGRVGDDVVGSLIAGEEIETGGPEPSVSDVRAAANQSTCAHAPRDVPATAGRIPRDTGELEERINAPRWFDIPVVRSTGVSAVDARQLGEAKAITHVSHVANHLSYSQLPHRCLFLGIAKPFPELPVFSGRL